MKPRKQPLICEICGKRIEGRISSAKACRGLCEKKRRAYRSNMRSIKWGKTEHGRRKKNEILKKWYTTQKGKNYFKKFRSSAWWKNYQREYNKSPKHILAKRRCATRNNRANFEISMMAMMAELEK